MFRTKKDIQELILGFCVITILLGLRVAVLIYLIQKFFNYVSFSVTKTFVDVFHSTHYSIKIIGFDNPLSVIYLIFIFIVIAKIPYVFYKDISKTNNIKL